MKQRGKGTVEGNVTRMCRRIPEKEQSSGEETGRTKGPREVL